MRCVSFTLANTPPHRPRQRAGCRSRMRASEASVSSSTVSCTEAATSSRLPVRTISSSLDDLARVHDAFDLAVLGDAVEAAQGLRVDGLAERGEAQHLALVAQRAEAQRCGRVIVEVPQAVAARLRARVGA